MCSLDLNNDNNAERCYGDGFGASSPAIGLLKSYDDGHIISNLVVLTENSWSTSSGDEGQIKIYHVKAKDGGGVELEQDATFDADEQTTCGSGEGALDRFVASPLIADLDHDSQNEIAGLSRSGTLYVVDYESSNFVLRYEVAATCASTNSPCSNLKMNGPIAVDVDDDDSLELLVGLLPATSGDYQNPYIKVYDYSSSSPYISEKFAIELDGYAVATICAGDMDGDDKVDVIAQAYSFGGRVWAYEFDDSDYDSSAGWWCEGGNPQRTSCAD